LSFYYCPFLSFVFLLFYLVFFIIEFLVSVSDTTVMIFFLQMFPLSMITPNTIFDPGKISDQLSFNLQCLFLFAEQLLLCMNIVLFINKIRP